MKNIFVSPVAIGRISIGEVVEKNGKRMPKKADHFSITSNVQKNGTWVPHPVAGGVAGEKIRSIPVRVMFDKPENSLNTSFACFNNKGRQVCSSQDGQNATRLENGSMEQVACAGPEACAFGQANRCKLYSRLMVSVDAEGQWEKDPLAGFVLRTTSYNSTSALTARLSQYAAMNKGRLAGMPCNLVLRAKSTSASMRQAIYYVDLEPRDSLMASFAEANAYHEMCEKAGVSLDALDNAVAAGRSRLVDSPEDTEDVAAEFYPEADVGQDDAGPGSQSGDLPVDPNTGEILESAKLREIKAKVEAIDSVEALQAARDWISHVRSLSDGEKRNALNHLEMRRQQVEQCVPA